MEKNKKSLIWGLVIVVVGLLYLCHNLNILGFNIFFDGWWTLFIIVPSAIGLFKNDEIFSGILGIIIGVLLLMATQDFIAWRMVVQIFIPFVIICIGVSLLIKPSIKPIIKTGKKGTREYISIFSGVDEKMSDKFVGGSCIGVFGGVKLDLLDAIIEDDIMIEVVAIFGGVEIKLPKNVIVKTNGVSIFGGAENQYNEKVTKNTPTVYINHVSIFGGAKIN